MTAFAAVLSLTGAPPGDHALECIAFELSGVTAAATSHVVDSDCALLLSPLHAWDPIAPVRSAHDTVVAAGQVMLEGRADLVSSLGLPRRAADLDIVGAGVGRWGPQSAEHFSGEYSFVTWEPRSRRVLCARDGFGVRLLYVARARDVVVVSNVLGAVIAHPSIPQDVDERFVLAFLTGSERNEPIRTPYQAVRSVPAGHTLTVSVDGTATLERHWWMPKPQARRRWPRHDVIDGYRDALRAAVDDRIGGRTATIFLSGGIDSTTIAAAASDAPTRLKAITVEYARIDTREEVAFARRAAAALSIPWSTVAGDRYEALDAEREGASALLVDEPTLADWRATVAAAGVSTVAIYGEDGDALFAPPGGIELLRAQGLPSLVFETVKMIAVSRRRPYHGIRARERLFGRRTAEATVPAWLTRDARRAIAERSDATVLGLSPQALPPHPTRDSIRRRLMPAVACSFAQTISPAVTRARVELRLPLLDTRVVRHVISVPPIPWCQRKQLARMAFRDELPADLLARPKTPLARFNDALVAAWRRGAGRAIARPVVGAVNPAWIDEKAWVRSIQSGSTNEAMAAWRLLIADAWLSRCRRGVERACIR